MCVKQDTKHNKLQSGSCPKVKRSPRALKSNSADVLCVYLGLVVAGRLAQLSRHANQEGGILRKAMPGKARQSQLPSG
jgi:hypothetical protein